MRATLAERFASYVERGDAGACWPWIGYRNDDGYGKIRVGGRHGRKVFAHRLAWEMANGGIPAELSVLHRCDNPPCVNPEHLFLGTQLDNVKDMRAKGRGSHGPGSNPKARGSLHGLARLTEASVAEILDRLAAGQLQREVAAGFGVSQATVSLLWLGKSWPHVPRPQGAPITRCG